MRREKDEVRNARGYLLQAFGVYPKVSAEGRLDPLALRKDIADRQPI